MKQKQITFLSLYRKIIKNYSDRKSFVLFKKPYENRIFFYSQNKKNNKKEKFFLIRSFDHKNTIEIHPKKIYFINIKNLQIETSDSHEKNNDYENNSYVLTYSHKYKNLIKKAISSIKNGFLKKVVVSRFIKFSFCRFSFKRTFQKLIFYYPNAFISLWYDSYYGFWIGASPELLIKSYDKEFKTISLAGTVFGNNKKWTKKELEEHKIVTEYLVTLLRIYSGNIYVGKTRIINMGHLFHLQTPINFSFFNKPNYFEILKKIHPTPSICGFPKKKSLDFIKENEEYQRGFYTGYIGTVDNNNNIELYLNLRCAKINLDKKEISLYAGSGITKQSIADKEYLETENKIKNILSQLIFFL
ncbi:chorismate-binding protein [Blattabacterium cuenoti]|uniref:chorismate-binding protein n=1 Tax=Blattabacterium cuenoti TaxID=1653831 RepID=UPI00163C7417|nr:chorismate-binding protein [Blattabacterium cuenoti]